jgi:hypothetical protein
VGWCCRFSSLRIAGLTPDGGIPAGAKFETFLAADRVLGLDLPRDIGRTGGRLS